MNFRSYCVYVIIVYDMMFFLRIDFSLGDISMDGVVLVTRYIKTTYRQKKIATILRAVYQFLVYNFAYIHTDILLL